MQQERKYILGIEGSANKLGIGIVDLSGKIIANLRKTYVPPTGSGFLPSETASHHQKHINSLIQEAMNQSNLKFNQIKLIAYTKGPGMGGCLTVGAIVARTLSQIHKIPIIGVNHCVAHIEMGRLVCGCEDPVVLYVSGGNTQIISYSSIWQKYLIYGETIDIAVGNCLDRFARLVGISNDPNPGYNIEKEALKGKKFYKLPYSVKGMDVSFTGILTNLEKDYVKKLKKKKIKVEDLCYSLQETVFAMLIEITERLLSYLGKSEVLIVGGVGCNKRLQEMMGVMLKERGGKVHGMDQRYCIDNGCMIAYTGLLQYKYEIGDENANNMEIIERQIKNSQVTQRFRTDKVICKWREKTESVVVN